MQIRVFTVPIHDDGASSDELNRFLRSRRVLQVEREFVQAGGGSCWCFCVHYLDGGAGVRSAVEHRRTDYREVLDAPAFARFSELRRRRKAIAEAEGVPAYAVFTDEQLAEMAKLADLTAATMAGVKGVGAGKVERYAARMLAASDGKDQEPDGDSRDVGGVETVEGRP